MISLLKPLLARRLVWALALLSGLAACGDKPAAVPASKFAAPESAPREPKQAADAAKPNLAATAEMGQRAADSALAARVKSALVADPDVNALEIDVVAAQGAITLFGTAPTRSSREKATRAAAGIEGVKSVVNKLAVVAGS